MRATRPRSFYALKRSRLVNGRSPPEMTGNLSECDGLIPGMVRIPSCIDTEYLAELS